MNSARRKYLSNICNLLREAEESLTACGDEEQDYADEMPENFTERRERAEEVASVILEAAEECRNVCDNILEIMETT